MMPAADPRPDTFGIGDCVVAIYAIGLFRTRVPRGTRGEVAGLSPAGEVEVQFANGRVELVRPIILAPCGPDAMPEPPIRDARASTGDTS